jgi:hypothetical protein
VAVAFVAGLVAAPSLYALVSVLPPVTIDASYPMLIVAGFLEA